MIIDQLTKFAATSFLLSSTPIPVAPSFNLTLVFNTGVAFGLLADLGPGVRELVLGGATILALWVVLYLLLTEYRESFSGQLAIGMIVGGALGNAIDRFLLGSVVDFFDFYLGQWHWPAFNIADSAICIGVGLLIFIKPPKSADQQKN
jgi:signal peptidase II